MSVEDLSFSLYNDNETEGNRRQSRLHRANTDASISDHRPQLRVRFHTLGTERQVSNPEINYISTTVHRLGRNLSGGWQNTIYAQRRSGIIPKTEEEEVTEIASAMEGDQQLMSDDHDGEVLRRDALRELTKSLRVKKEIKKRLSSRKSSLGEISCINTFKYSLSMKWFIFKEKMKDVLHDYTIWHKDLKVIEGIYGTSVGSYFRFLRYLFLLNLFVTCIVLGFLFVPQTLHDSNFSNYTIYDLSTSTGPIFTSISDKAVTIDEREGLTTPPSTTFGALDWITGAGWFRETELYYGGYITGSFKLVGSRFSYDMSQAYLFTILICFVIYFVVLLFRIFQLYKVNYVDASKEISMAFAEKIFSAWDFKITDPVAVKVKQRSIYNELIELLQELQYEDLVVGVFQRLVQRSIRAITWFVLVSFLALLGFAFYILLKDELFSLAENDTDYYRNSLKMLIYPFIVTLLMIIIPVIFESMGRFERYSKQRHELYATVIRVFLLELTILVVLVLFWYTTSPGLREEWEKIDTYFDDERLSDTRKSRNNTVACWESVLGEEMYRLVFVDFLVILISVLVVDSSRKYLSERNKADILLQQFNIARSILHIIYNETLLWAGIFFCPQLPLIISIKFFIIFYLQKFNVMKNHEPLERPWRAAQTETLFYCLALFSLILCFFSLGFILVSIVLYCLKNVAEGRAELVSLLRKQIAVEIKDRIFLQKLIEKVQKGESIPTSPARNGITPPSFSPADAEDRHLSKRSSFVFSRSRDKQEATSAL